MNRPPDSRVVIDEMDADRWRIVIPGRPTGGRMFAAIFLLCWIAGWAVGEVFALRAVFARQRDPGIDWSLAAWALGWTAGGVGAMWLLRRVLDLSFGIESLLIDAERTKLVRALWGRASIRAFETPKVERFEAGGWGLRFVCDGRGVGFGAALTPEERAWLLEELQRILAGVKNRR